MSLVNLLKLVEEMIIVLVNDGQNASILVNINYLHFYLFFFWHYSSWWTLASTKIILHSSRSCSLHLHFLSPMFFRSSSTERSHLNWGFPTRRVASGLGRVSFLQGSSFCILQGCPSHLNLPIFITLTMSGSPYSARSTLVYLVLHTPLSFTGP